MLTAPLSRFREKPATAWAAIAGVILIVTLLWAFGAVVQGQVERAQDRFAQAEAMQQQAQALRCLPTPSHACDAAQATWSAPAGQAIEMRPVPVAYR